MKPQVVVVIGIGVILVAALGYGLWAATHRTSDTPVHAGTGPLMVDELKSRPERFATEIAVSGVVGATNAALKQFGLVDTREAEKCGTVQCPEFVLPVSWEGDMPRVGEAVTVLGRVERSDGGLVLRASEVKR